MGVGIGEGSVASGSTSRQQHCWRVMSTLLCLSCAFMLAPCIAFLSSCIPSRPSSAASNAQTHPIRTTGRAVLKAISSRCSVLTPRTVPRADRSTPLPTRHRPEQHWQSQENLTFRGQFRAKQARNRRTTPVPTLWMALAVYIWETHAPHFIQKNFTFHQNYCPTKYKKVKHLIM